MEFSNLPFTLQYHFYLFTYLYIYTMKQKESTRNYRLSDAELKQLGDSILSLINRDIVEFNDRGFNPTKQAELANAIQVFSDYPSDEQLEGQKIAATEDKNNARKSVEKSLRTFFLAAENVFGYGTGRHKEFGNTDISRQTDEELVRNAKILIQTANKYLSQLGTEGITQTKIDLLDTQRQVFDSAIDTQKIAIRDRDAATEERINLGNTLYGLVSKYANIGKDIWYDTNESCYNDYVIYGSSESAGQDDTIIGV